MLDLPAGPYLRVEGNGLTVTVQGQTLTADVVIERATGGRRDRDDRRPAGVDLAIGAGANGVRITGGSGLLLVTAAGVAGRISGTIAVTLPAGTTLTGALTLAVNTALARRSPRASTSAAPPSPSTSPPAPTSASRAPASCSPCSARA